MLRTLQEHVLLLEYDHDKTWNRYGEKIHQKMHDTHRAAMIPSVRDLPTTEYNTPEENKANFNDNVLKYADPTPHQEYSQWISRHYAEGNINRLEDIHGRTKEALARFHDAKVRGHLRRMGLSADINQYKGLGPLEDVVDKLPKQEPKAVDDRPEPHEYEKHEDEHWTHIIPKTEKASQYYGRGTRWCTAATKGGCMFSHYHDQGPLHILIPKRPNYAGEKYQIHIPSGQMMDERDDFDTRSPRLHGPYPEGVRRDAHDNLRDYVRQEFSPHDRVDFTYDDSENLATHVMEPHDYDEYSRDPHPMLRNYAALYGTEEHSRRLFHDEHPDVRDTAKHKLDNIHLRGG